MSSSELLYSLLCPPCTPVEEATEEIADSVVELVLACLARNSSTHFCALPVLLWKKQKPES